MRQEQQRQLDSLVRAQDFIGQNPELVGSMAGSEDATQLADVLAQVRHHITAQGSNVLVAHGLTGQVHGMAKNLVRRHLGPIAKFARASLKGVPEYAMLVAKVRVSSPKGLVTKAYAVAEAAKPYVSRMVAAGFAADTVDQLLAATNDLNEVIVKREPMAKDRVRSTREIVTLIELGRDSVKKIDAVLAHRLATNAPALAAWKSASRVQAKVGSVRKPASVKPEIIESAVGTSVIAAK
jgi:hypothetical protein